MDILQKNREYQRQHYQKNKQEKNETSRKWREANPEKMTAIARKSYENKKKNKPEALVLNSIKQRCKKRNLPFDLTIEDLGIKENCPYFDVPIAWNNKTSKPEKFSASVDRIIPDLGYVKGNIQLISHLANRMKQDATIEELLLFSKGVLKKHEQTLS